MDSPVLSEEAGDHVPPIMGFTQGNKKRKEKRVHSEVDLATWIKKSQRDEAGADF